MVRYQITEFFIRNLKAGAKITVTLQGRMWCPGEVIYKIHPDFTYPECQETEFFHPASGTISHWTNFIECDYD
jgi:hypothetical protein